MGLPRHPAHGEDIGLLSILEINMEFIEQEGSPKGLYCDCTFIRSVGLNLYKVQHGAESENMDVESTQMCEKI